jgi:hypothetical protein
MTTYTVGLKLQTRTKALTIEADDALLAAQKWPSHCRGCNR